MAGRNYLRSVVKFGGSSLADAKALARATSLVTASSPNLRRQHVVVSAPGKRDDADVKVTDLLLAAQSCAASSDSLNFDHLFADQIAPRFPNINVSTTAADIYDRAQNSNKQLQSIDFTVSRGEFLNGQVVAQALDGYDFVDPADGFIVFDPNTRELDLSATLDAIRRTVGKELPERNGVVVPGFYGSIRGNASDIVTFSRGGSDITASLIAAALDDHDVLHGFKQASQHSSFVVHENFTDVDGIYNVDPRIARAATVSASLLATVGYNQCRAMALAGASVLHPDAIVPLQQRNVPIWVRNSFTDTHDDPAVDALDSSGGCFTCVQHVELDCNGTNIVLAICSQQNIITFVCKNKVKTTRIVELIQQLTRAIVKQSSSTNVEDLSIGQQDLSWKHESDLCFSVEIDSGAVGPHIDQVVGLCFEHVMA